MTIKTTATALVAIIALSSTSHAANPPDDGPRRAHDAYVAAINANDLNAFLDTVTNDIVFIAPNAPAIEGKDAVAPWVGGYFGAVRTNWQKTSLEFVVAGNWAFERYTYRVIDAPRGGGAASIDTGNGINIYQLEADGVWRVARDAWASNGAMTARAFPASCTGAEAPC